jgi:hypothetical protein
MLYLVLVVIGMLVRAFTRRAVWSVMLCLVLPPAAIVLTLKDALFVDRGLAHAAALSYAPLILGFAFAATATGVLLGFLVRPPDEKSGNTNA